jgi:kynureninase
MKTVSDLLNDAKVLDDADHLAYLSERFVSNNDLIYLDGNSLGALPKSTVELMSSLVNHQWGNRLIRSWNESWIDLPKRIAAKIARLTGAAEDEIFVGDSTSVNLFKLAYGVLKLQQGRSKIISDELNFPSDFYVLQGLAHGLNMGHKLLILPSADGISADMQGLECVIDQTVALVCLSHVAFKSAYMYNMAAVNAMAKNAGVMVLWDLSHAIGSVPIHLNSSGAELAVGCTYKYLNGGPGSPAFLYVRKDIQDQLDSPIWAWFGHASPFAFQQHYQALPDVWKYAAGTPPILSMAAIEPGLDLLLEAGMQALRAKSLSLSSLFLEAYHALLEPLGFQLASPANPEMRGSHIALRHPEGYRICQALINPTDEQIPVIPDFRQPDIIRFGFAPLYNTHTQVIQTALRLSAIVSAKTYLHYDPTPLPVS